VSSVPTREGRTPHRASVQQNISTKLDYIDFQLCNGSWGQKRHEWYQQCFGNPVKFLEQLRSGRFLPLSKKLLPTQEGWKMKNDFQLLGNNFLKRGKNLPLQSRFRKITWFLTSFIYYLCPNSLGIKSYGAWGIWPPVPGLWGKILVGSYLKPKISSSQQKSKSYLPADFFISLKYLFYLWPFLVIFMSCMIPGHSSILQHLQREKCWPKCYDYQATNWN